MKTYIKNAFGIIAFALMLGLAGTALAQTAPTVSIGTSGPTNVMVVNDSSAGTVVGNSRHVSVPTAAVTMVTIDFTSMQNRSVQVSTIPVSIITGGGAAASYLSSCQLFSNATGTALNTGSNIPASVSAGSNSFVLDAPLVVGPGATQSVSLRCTISASAVPGNTFDTGVIPSATVISLPPVLSVTATAIPAIQNNATPAGNVVFGTARLDATESGSDIRVSSVPVSVSTTGGASAGSVLGCQLFSPSNVALNTTANVGGVMSSGSNSIVLDTPFVVPSNTFTTLTLRCSVAPPAISGGTIQLTLGSGSPFGLSSTGAGPVVLSVANITNAPVPVVGGIIIPPITPGVPGTGAGTASAAIYFILAAASVIVLGGALYAKKTS
ncbi:MAG: hypothetical protein Q7R93_05035 [bacterium]|nr:hypothetical protein [bacterium]